MSQPKVEIPRDLQRTMREFVEADAEERARFFADTDAFLETAGPDFLRRLSPLERIKWQLARERRTDTLIKVVTALRRNAAAFDVRGLRTPRARIPGVDASELPREAATLTAKDLPLVTRLTDMTWVDDKLRLRGYAYIRNVPMSRPPRLSRLAWLRERGSRRRVPVRLHARREPRATSDSKQALHNYDWAGFEIEIDPNRLKESGTLRPGQWTLTIAVMGPGGLRKGALTKGEIGTSGHPCAHRLSPDMRWVCGFRKNTLDFTLERVNAEITSAATDDSGLRLELTTARPLSSVSVEHSDGEESRSAEYPATDVRASGGRHQATVRIPTEDLAVVTEPDGKTRDLRVNATLEDGTSSGVVTADGFVPVVAPLPNGREIAVNATPAQGLLLHDRVRQAVVDTMEWNNGVLRLCGDYTGEPEERTLILRHGERFEEIELPFEHTDGRFTLTIDPEAIQVYDARLPLRRGRWYMTLRPSAAWGRESDVPVKLRGDRIAQLPLPHKGSTRTFTVDRRFGDRIFLASGSPLRPEDRGSYHQRRLKEDFAREQRQLPLRNTVFYYNYHGRQFSDSPRAIHEELLRRGIEIDEHLWGVEDGQVQLPPGVTPVEWKSREWYEALCRSRYVVTNVAMGWWFQRREGQTVVQTWHGTPLKKLGRDLLGTKMANRVYIETQHERAAQWDFFVSPNPLTTEVMRTAYVGDTEILESGYPRNDVFHSEERDAIARRTKDLLGIPADKKVLLYAPTWRDDQRHARRVFKFDLQIDLEAAQRELGEDHVLLVRKHPKLVDTVPGAGQGFIWDVSKYPEIADLYLVADVLITDYSSASFDYAHSGKPMLFYTYDLEHYRDTLRGFYFDFTERAPGPLLETTDELIAAVRDVDAITEKYRDRYASFVADFCTHSDGQATRRVVDRMLGLPAAEVPAEAESDSAMEPSSAGDR
ncbi:CDP-glycerol glycerophosphotransferase family protein [Spiractinospora alimapuensis]|uniref:CDP-glycerol glycerophosphotransferase family protein n=1 Tax=Spiractinospora alimapuensis TaxID=2820884 RepID=UPI001F253074|nr:CDP-glycerol glycerophosphotransferase family protein [Spiractinospora alimapuensis]QVQ53943.1 CDP-glycerol glycerophosphotransferase family protein [Spiractinospora alimapuensis]